MSIMGVNRFCWLRLRAASSVKGIPGFPFRSLAALVWTLVLLATLMSAATRRVTDETGRTVDIPAYPQRIVSIAPSVTELLYGLGLEQRVVGRTDFCDFPPEARQKPSVGGLINPSVEMIVSLHPDLVIGTPEINKIEVANRLAQFHIPLYGIHVRSLEDVLRSLSDLGEITGAKTQSAALVRSLRARQTAVARRIAGLRRPRVLYLIWYSPISVPGRDAFLTDLVARAGGQSISGDLNREWAQMSLEEIVRRDPEFILIPESNESSPPVEQLKTWPGWKATTAARTHRILVVRDSANHPSPRLFDALEEFTNIFHGTSNTGK